MTRLNPFLRKAGNTGPGTRAEKKAAVRFGARTTPGSGSLEGAKGDFDLDGLKFENKSTVCQSLSLKYAWLKKISKEALDAGKDPALSIQFTDGNGKPQKNGAWVMVPESVFKELIDGS